MDDSTSSFPDKFFTALQRRSESDASVVATLRRSLTFEPGTDARAFPLIERWTSEQNPRRRRIIYLVAGLWGQLVRQGREQPKLFPEAMRHVHRLEKSNSIEKRFISLLDADDDELRWRLRSTLALVASKGIALDWPRLLDDLLEWHYGDRRVQMRWAKIFWGQEL